MYVVTAVYCAKRAVLLTAVRCQVTGAHMHRLKHIYLSYQQIDAIRTKVLHSPSSGYLQCTALVSLIDWISDPKDTLSCRARCNAWIIGVVVETVCSHAKL